MYENFKNKEKFKKFLQDVLVSECFDFEAYLEELERQHDCSGSDSYEVSRFETKSGNPEMYFYETKTVFFDDDGNEVEPEENDFAYCETKFIL